MLVAGCTTRGPATPAPVQSSPLMLGEPQVAALGALLQMEDERALDSAAITRYSRDPHPEVRARAALAIGRIRDARGRDLLLAAVDDSVPAVRAAAVFALGELRDSSTAVLGALEHALARADTAAILVPAALARANSTGAYDVLSGLLRRAPKAKLPQPLLREALLNVWRFTRKPGFDSLALPFVHDGDAAIRWAATYAIARVPTLAATPVLVQQLGDADALVRATAARGIRPAFADSLGIAAQARDALRLAVRDPHPHVRINAARALAAYRNGEDAAALLPLLADADANVRVATAEALAAVPGEASTAALRGSAADASLPLVLRAAALNSLARLDSVAAHRAAAEWSRGQSWLQRFYAVRTLSALAWPQVQGDLLAAARDADPRVRAEALGSIAGADTTGAHASLFLEELASPDPLVRAAAATGLGRKPDAAYFSALMEAYERAQQDTINDAALATIDALARLTRANVPVARTFFLRFRSARDPIVRARVAQHFGTGEGTWGPATPVRTGRSAEFYQQVVRELVLPQLVRDKRPQVRIRTARGDIVLALDPAAAPLTVRNFMGLIQSGFYRVPTLRWHRVVPNFVLQDGDPRGDGSGGPPDIIRDEINTLRYERGALGMALSGPDTGGSQYFITHSPQPHLDGGYTIFGRVIAGMDVADAILQDDAILAIELVR